MSEMPETTDPRESQDGGDSPPDQQELAIRLGAPVETSDGVGIGRVDRVVVDPVARIVTDLIVHQTSLLSRDIVVPVGGVELADDAGVRMIFTFDDLGRLPDFVESTYIPLEGQDRPPLITWEDGSEDDGRTILVPAAMLYQPEVMPFAPRIVEEQRNTTAGGTVDIVVGTVVEDEAGEIGRVDEVAVEVETGRLIGVVVEGEDGSNFLGLTDLEILPGDPVRLRLRPAAESATEDTAREPTDEAGRSAS